MKYPLYIFITSLLLLSGCAESREVMQKQSTAQKQVAAGADTVDQSDLLEARSQYFEGIKQFELENYEGALDHLMAAYVKMPDRAGVNYALADAYLQLEDLTNAAKYGKQATELEPANKWYHLKLYEIYRNAGRNQATIQELKRILKYHPDDVGILSRLADTYEDYGEQKKAIKVYNRILKAHGPDVRTHMKKFRAFRRLNMSDSTLKELQRIRALDPGNLSTLHTLGEFYLDNNYPQEAQKTLKEALDQNPRNPQSLIMMAEAYMQKNQWDSAGTMLQNIVTDTLIAPYGKMEIARFMFAQFKQDANNPQLREQTGRILSSLTQFEPESEMAHALAADFYLETRQTDKALEHLKRSLELNPNNTAVWRERIRLLYIQRKHDRIIELASEADEYAPQDPFITFFIGSSHLLNQNHREAIKWLSESSTLPAKKSFKSIVYGSLGDAHSSIDQWEEADQAYERALEMDSTNHNAMNNYAYYLSKREKRLEYAKKLALQALELLPGNSSYLDTAGWVYYKLEDYEKAREYIEKAAQTDNPGVAIMEHLGNVYEKLNQLEKARTWWKKAYEEDTSKTYLKDKIDNISIP